MIELVGYVDDVLRIATAVLFLWFAVRWSTSTAWWLWWDTRALFYLLVVCALLTSFAVLVAAGWIPPAWTPWVAATTWALAASAAGFLSVGYEREQWRERQRRIPRQHRDKV